MLEAVLLAEAKDHSSWSTLAQLVPKLPEGVRTAFADATQRVEQQEDEHLGWAKEMRSKMISLQSIAVAAAATGMARSGTKPVISAAGAQPTPGSLTQS